MKLINVTLFWLCFLGSLQKSPEEVLGFSDWEDPTPEEIKDRFRELSKQYHPDRNTDSNAREKYEEIVNAYEALTKKDGDGSSGGGRSNNKYYYDGQQFTETDFRKMEEEFFKHFGNSFSQEENSFTVNFSDLVFS